MTFFSENHHLEVIRRALRNVNASAHPPFSVEPERLTKHVLESRGLSRYVSDGDLVSFLSNVNNRAFSREDISDLMSSLGMKILSWLPSAYSHPYGKRTSHNYIRIVIGCVFVEELPHHSIQVYRAHGMSEKDVVESVTGGFRYTVYVSRSDAADLSGRRRVTEDIIESDTSYTVVDRVGYLGGTFANGAQYAVSSQTISLDLCPFENNRTIFNLAAHPQVLASFSKLSSGLTIRELIDFNAQTLGSAYSDSTSKQMLLRSLQFFESQNMITLWKHPSDWRTSADKSRTEVSSPSGGSGAKADKFANSGLKFGKKPLDESRVLKEAGPNIDTLKTVEERTIYFKSLNFSDAMIKVFLRNEGFYRS